MSSLELTQDQKRTKGDVPPATVGSTVTVVGSKLFLFAGRQVATRRMTTDVYCLDVGTSTWSRVDVVGPTRPRSRYFHSANAHGNAIVVFGGMSSSAETEDLCVLNDVAIFDTIGKKWHICEPRNASEGEVLRPRYAHLSSISAGKLVIIGGQNKENEYLTDVGIFDLTRQVWEKVQPIQGQYGAYRSLSVTSTRMPETSLADLGTEMSAAETPYLITTSSPVSSRGSWNGSIKTPTINSDLIAARRPSASSIPVSPARPRPNLRKKSEVGAMMEKPEEKVMPGPAQPIFLYSNFNFVNVERHLHMIDPPKDSFNVADKSNLISGAILPPGLRFPSGAVVGHHLVICGTYLTNSSQLFAIWAMSLDTYEWTRIDVCDRLSAGSWNKGIYCAARNEFILLGHRDRSLVEDYNHRQVNFDHVTVLSLEPFGILETGQQTMSPLAQQFGKLTMADKALCDMEIVTRDYTMIPVSSSILSQKWPDYQKFMKEDLALPSQPIVGSRLSAGSRGSKQYYNHSESRLRALFMPHPHDVVKLLIAFFYTDNLPTDGEPELTVLCSTLLLLATVDKSGTNIHFKRLAQLCLERLHLRITIKNARNLCDIATLTGHHGLQARASRLLSQEATRYGLPTATDKTDEAIALVDGH